MSRTSGRKVQLPHTIFREVAVLDGYLGAAGPAHIFQAKLSNLPALIGEMMIAGESDPNLFQLDYKFTMGKGPITDEGVIAAIRSRADVLWKEFKGGTAAKNRERYLRVIDGRLLDNPSLAVRAPAHQGGDSRDAERLISEDRALRKLNHRNIVRRYARVDDPSLGPCILMEHVQGKTLDRIWRRRGENKQGPLPLPAVAHIAYQLAHALSHAHQQGVVHGEMHPANILIEESPTAKTKGVVKLAGFGGGGAGGATALPYSAPEQVRDGVPSPATDVYQLGATLYVLATGRLMYESASPDDLRELLVSGEPHPARVHHSRPEISPRFEALIEAAREKDPAKRWPVSKVVEEITQIYASKSFSLDDAPKGSIAEELIVRVQTDYALKDFYRALEALDMAKDFLEGVPGPRGEEVRRRFDSLSAQIEPHRVAVEQVRTVQKKHIAPVDHLMEELYTRYGNGEPLLTHKDKGVMKGEGTDTVIVKRSLIDGILQHTSAAIQALSTINAELVGDMHRKMVDRASSQEEACSDLAKRMIQFGDDYIKG
ncbi:MAG TPA: serine/threonine-protein kinase [Planctomycetota bacterium]|nr:serine/threonine-protein kinase [Planctomycetota bacterium]